MLQFDYAAVSRPGGLPVNEDSICVGRLSGGGAVFCLADGLGGQGGGRLASGAAVQTFVDSLLQAFETGEAGTESVLLKQAAREANEAVFGRQRQKDGRMMSTLVGLVIREGRASWVHVGDSRLYCLKDGSHFVRTLDHSVPQMAAAMGMIREDQIRFHEDRSRVLRALGSDTFEPEVSRGLDISQGGFAFLLCSDGFWEYVLESEMEETLARSASAAEWIQNMEALLAVRVPPDADNYSAVVILTAAA